MAAWIKRWHRAFVRANRVDRWNSAFLRLLSDWVHPGLCPDFTEYPDSGVRDIQANNFIPNQVVLEYIAIGQGFLPLASIVGFTL